MKRRAKILGGCEHDPIVAAKNEDGSVEIIYGRQVTDGQPIHPGQPLYSISQDGDSLAIETLVEGSGPPKVATRAYRKNYDTIFGKPKTASKAN